MENVWIALAATIIYIALGIFTVVLVEHLDCLFARLGWFKESCETPEPVGWGWNITVGTFWPLMWVLILCVVIVVLAQDLADRVSPK